MRRIVAATIKASAGQAATLLCAAASIKALAMIAGPAGVGVFSLLRQLQQTLSSVASLGGQNAIVQGLTSLSDSQEMREYRAASFISIAIGSLAVFLGLFIFSEPVANNFLPDHEVKLIRWLCLPIGTGVVLIYFRGVLNAGMHIGPVAWVNTVTSLGAMLLAFPAGVAYTHGHPIALIIMLTGSLGLGAFTAVYFSFKYKCLDGLWHSLLIRPKIVIFLKFLKVALPSLAVTFVAMGSVLLVRSNVAQSFGFVSAGYFDAAWAISAMYLTLFLASLQTYLLPTMSANVNSAELHQELNNALRLSAIVVVPMISGLILLKPLAINILYSGKFIDAINILRWTLMADYLRVIAWIFAIMLLAHADMRAYFVREMLWNIVFVLLSLWLMKTGIEGAGPAYLIAYVFYLVSHLWRAIHQYHVKITFKNVMHSLFGFTIVLLVSGVTWFDRTVVWWKTGFVLVAFLFSWTLLKASERSRIAQFLHLGRNH